MQRAWPDAAAAPGCRTSSQRTRSLTRGGRKYGSIHTAWHDGHGANVRGLLGVGDRGRTVGPIHSGLLTGKFSREWVESLPEDDWRHRSPDCVSVPGRNLGPTDAPRMIAGQYRVTQAAVAVVRALAFPSHRGNRRCRNNDQVDGSPPRHCSSPPMTSMRSRPASSARARVRTGHAVPCTPRLFNLRRIPATGRQT